MCHIIAQLIEFGRLSTLSGNNQWCSCLINQDRVDLIDDGIMQISLYQLLFIDYHIVTQIVETKLVIGDIGNVAVICGAALFFCGSVQYHTYGQSQKFMDFTHPAGITACQVIINRYDMDALAVQRI